MKKFKKYIIYTILYALIASFFFLIFYKNGKSFIWDEDGLKQHFLILYDYNEILRNGFSNFSWQIGLGQDVIGQYSYYIIGDIFAYISLLFPMDKLDIAYNTLIFVRIYFIGISFLIFSSYKKFNNFSSVVGTILYTFCGFVLYAGVRHPYFLNPIILLPLNLIAIEELIKKNKIFPLIVTTFFCIVVNYYFFYILTFINLIYAFSLYFGEYNEKSFKVLINKILKAALAYIIAVLLASAIFLPTVYTFLNCSRSGSFHFSFYDFVYYEKLLIGLVTNSPANTRYWSILGMSSIVILFIPLLIKHRKKYNTIYKSFIFMTLILLIPLFSQILNGFSYPINRFIFAYAFILAYMVASFLNENSCDFCKKDLICMLVGTIIYFVLSFLDGYLYQRKYLTELLIMLSFGFAILLLLFIKNIFLKKKGSKVIEILTILIVTLNVMAYGYYLYGNEGTIKYNKSFVNSGEITDAYNTLEGNVKNYDKAISLIKKDDSFYRVSRYPLYPENTSLILNYNPISSFLSLGSGGEGTLSSSLNNSKYSISRYLMDFDGRTKITTLLGTKYFITSDSREIYIPYGYSKIDSIDNMDGTYTNIYMNNYYLPLGILYNTYITNDEFNSLSDIDKEQIMLKSAVVDNDVNINVKHNDAIEESLNNNYASLNYEIDYDDKYIKFEDGKIVTNNKNQKIKIKIKDVKNSELYLKINELEYDQEFDNNVTLVNNPQKYIKQKLMKKHNDIPIIDYKINVTRGALNKSESSRNYFKDPYYYENKNVLINLGYVDDYSGTIELNLEKKGIYTFDSLEILAVDMDNYVDSVKTIGKMNVTEYGDDFIKGTIESENSGILQISTSYSKGWRAYVDGKEEEVIKLADSLMGIYVDSGKHEIIFKYETPYLKVGCIFSLIGLLTTIVVFIFEKKKSRRK